MQVIRLAKIRNWKTYETFERKCWPPDVGYRFGKIGNWKTYETFERKCLERINEHTITCKNYLQKTLIQPKLT